MKRILIALMVATAFCTMSLAQKKATIVNDTVSQNTSSSVTVSSADDSTFVAEYEDVIDSTNYAGTQSQTVSFDGDWPFNMTSSAIGGGMFIAALSIIMIFGFPLFIIFIAFYFRYKNRKSKYKLIEQAIASGQPIPENLFKEHLNNIDSSSKGIKNICLGIGLFVFLWGITGSFRLGCIGLLIMFIGFGQWLSARNQKNRPENIPNYRTRTDRNSNPEEPEQ